MRWLTTRPIIASRRKYDAAKGLPASVSRQGATVPQLKDVVAETAHLLDTLIIDVKEGNRHRAAKVAMGGAWGAPARGKAGAPPLAGMLTLCRCTLAAVHAVSIVLKAAKCNNCVVWSKSDYVTNSIKDNYRDIAAGRNAPSPSVRVSPLSVSLSLAHVGASEPRAQLTPRRARPQMPAHLPERTKGRS